MLGDDAASSTIATCRKKNDVSWLIYLINLRRTGTGSVKKESNLIQSNKDFQHVTFYYILQFIRHIFSAEEE